MGLGRLIQNRALQFQVTDTASGTVQSYELFSPADAGLASTGWNSIGYRGAMAIPGAWRAAVLISDLLGGLPWHATRQRAGADAVRVPSPLLDQPSPPDTRMSTFSSLALDLMLEGNGIGLYTARDAYGYPTAVLPVPASLVGVRRARYDETVFTPGEVLYQVGDRVHTSADVLHIKGPHQPGSLRGMGVLEQHLDTLSLASEQARQARALTDHAVPTGKLKSANPDLTQDEARDLKAAWQESQRTRTVAVLNSTTDFEPLSWNPSETQLLEARKFSLLEIALIFGLDPSWLGASQTSRVYTNAELEGMNLVRFTLGGHLARFEQALSATFPRGTTVKANLDALLRADTKTRYEAHQIAITSGFLTVDEVRALEDRAPLPKPVEPTPPEVTG